MPNSAKRRGDSAEREIARILTDQLGPLVRRRLGAGRRDDTGDLDGLAQTTVEVKAFKDVLRGLNEGLADSVREQTNAGTPFGVAFIRRPGGRWFAAMTVEQWCAMYRETLTEAVVQHPSNHSSRLLRVVKSEHPQSAPGDAVHVPGADTTLGA